MDYVYGELNTKVIDNMYKGGQTDTANVTVDNSTNTIYVDTRYPEIITEVKASVSKEALAREQADSVLQSNIDVEVTNRQADINDLKQQIIELQQQISKLDNVMKVVCDKLDIDYPTTN